MNLYWRKNNLANPKPARIHSPDPFLRAGNAVSVLRKSISPENSFRKTESTELALEFRQFLLWRNPTSPAATIPKIEKGSRGKSKQNAWWRGEGGAEQQKRRQTVVSDSLVERRLCCDGIRRGAYDLLSHHHTLRACHIICFGNRCEFGTIQTLKNIKAVCIRKRLLCFMHYSFYIISHTPPAQANSFLTSVSSCFS